MCRIVRKDMYKNMCGSLTGFIINMSGSNDRGNGNRLMDQASRVVHGRALEGGGGSSSGMKLLLLVLVCERSGLLKCWSLRTKQVPGGYHGEKVCGEDCGNLLELGQAPDRRLECLNGCGSRRKEPGCLIDPRKIPRCTP